jgi:hypothetical protein
MYVEFGSFYSDRGVYRFFTPPPVRYRLKYQPKLPSVSVFHFGITVGIFLLYDLAVTPFEDFAGTLFLKIWHELLYFLKRRAKCTKGGRSPPPFLWEKGAPVNFKIPILPTEFPFGIRYENTEKILKGSYRNTESVYNSSKVALVPFGEFLWPSSHVTGPRFVNNLRHGAWKDTYATV